MLHITAILRLWSIPWKHSTVEKHGFEPRNFFKSQAKIYHKTVEKNNDDDPLNVV